MSVGDLEDEKEWLTVAAVEHEAQLLEGVPVAGPSLTAAEVVEAVEVVEAAAAAAAAAAATAADAAAGQAAKDAELAEKTKLQADPERADVLRAPVTDSMGGAGVSPITSRRHLIGSDPNAVAGEKDGAIFCDLAPASHSSTSTSASTSFLPPAMHVPPDLPGVSNDAIEDAIQALEIAAVEDAAYKKQVGGGQTATSTDLNGVVALYMAAAVALERSLAMSSGAINGTVQAALEGKLAAVVERVASLRAMASKHSGGVAKLLDDCPPPPYPGLPKQQSSKTAPPPPPFDVQPPLRPVSPCRRRPCRWQACHLLAAAVLAIVGLAALLCAGGMVFNAAVEREVAARLAARLASSHELAPESGFQGRQRHPHRRQLPEGFAVLQNTAPPQSFATLQNTQPPPPPPPPPVAADALCRAAAARLCGDSGGADSCSSCLQSHAAELMAASCRADDFVALCNAQQPLQEVGTAAVSRMEQQMAQMERRLEELVSNHSSGQATTFARAAAVLDRLVELGNDHHGHELGCSNQAEQLKVLQVQLQEAEQARLEAEAVSEAVTAPLIDPVTGEDRSWPAPRFNPNLHSSTDQDARVGGAGSENDDYEQQDDDDYDKVHDDHDDHDDHDVSHRRTHHLGAKGKKHQRTDQHSEHKRYESHGERRGDKKHSQGKRANVHGGQRHGDSKHSHEKLHSSEKYSANRAPSKKKHHRGAKKKYHRGVKNDARSAPSASGCWEAVRRHYPDCEGYEEAGYTCVGDSCAAMNPGGTPKLCAVQAPAGSSLDATSGTCNRPPLKHTREHRQPQQSVDKLLYRVLPTLTGPLWLRAGVEYDSAKMGELTPGTVVEVLEEGTNSLGIKRVRTARGWASVNGQDGHALLVPVERKQWQHDGHSWHRDR